MIKAILKTALFSLLIAGVIFYAFAFYPLHNPHPPLMLPPNSLVIRGAKIYPSPDSVPRENATILIRDGKIAAVGDASLAIPVGATTVPCNGCVVTAGFWNAHVHFTERKWGNAEWASANRLNAHHPHRRGHLHQTLIGNESFVRASD